MAAEIQVNVVVTGPPVTPSGSLGSDWTSDVAHRQPKSLLSLWSRRPVGPCEMDLGSLANDLWLLHTKDSAQSYYSNELSKEDWVHPESENIQKNDQLGPRGELSPPAQNQENKKGDLREDMDTRKFKPIIKDTLFSDGFCSSAWVFLCYIPFCFSHWSEPLFFHSESSQSRRCYYRHCGRVCLLAQSCLTLCDPMDCSPPGSSVHGILQARILECVAMPSSRGSSQPRDQTQVSHTVSRFFFIWATREAQEYWDG